MIGCLNKTVKIVSKVEIPDWGTELYKKLDMILEKIDHQSELEKKVDFLTDFVKNLFEEKENSQEKDEVKEAMKRMEERLDAFSKEFEKIEKIQLKHMENYDTLLTNIGNIEAKFTEISKPLNETQKSVSAIQEQISDTQKNVKNLEEEFKSEMEKFKRQHERQLENSDEILEQIGKIKRKISVFDRSSNAFDHFPSSEEKKTKTIEENNKIEEKESAIRELPTVMASNSVEFGEFRKELIDVLKNIEGNLGHKPESVAAINNTNAEFQELKDEVVHELKLIETHLRRIPRNTYICACSHHVDWNNENNVGQCYCGKLYSFEPNLSKKKWMKFQCGHYQQLPLETEKDKNYKCDRCKGEYAVSEVFVRPVWTLPVYVPKEAKQSNNSVLHYSGYS